MISNEEKIVGMLMLLLFLSLINTIVFYFEPKTHDGKDEKISDPIEIYINKITNRYEMHMVHENEEESEEQTNNHLESNNEQKKDETEKQLVNEHNYMLEYTPVGYVIMKYSNEKQGFEYYSNRSLPYRLLEALSKKFVMVFGCKELYKIMKNETKKTETQKKMQHKSYAKLKPVQKEKIEKTMNVYHYKGKTNEFIFLKTDNFSKTKDNHEKPLSYSDFKRKIYKK